MICLGMAVINHYQPEGTANTHGKESGVAHQSTHRAVCICGHMCTRCTNVYFVNVCLYECVHVIRTCELFDYLSVLAMYFVCLCVCAIMLVCVII